MIPWFDLRARSEADELAAGEAAAPRATTGQPRPPPAGSGPSTAIRRAARRLHFDAGVLAASSAPALPPVVPGTVVGTVRARALREAAHAIDRLAAGAPVHAPEEKELSVLGVALLATATAGGRAEIETAVTVVEPNEVWRRHHAEVFAVFAAS